MFMQNEDFFCHQTKQVYKVAVTEALEWLQKEGKNATVASAARKFRVQQHTLQQAIRWQYYRTRNFRVFNNKNGDNNKILNEAQEEASRQYYLEQWELGLGASHQMAFGAISHLRQAKIISICCWTGTNYHRILIFLSHPVAGFAIGSKIILIFTQLRLGPLQQRLNSRTEKDYNAWFKEYAQTLEQYQITGGKQVINMDESSERVSCPHGQPIVIPSHVRELYTSSPEKCRSVTIIETIIADGGEPPLPDIIVPGSKFMDR
ncbi:hypothetical protein K3495_g13959 [Podosphaera aphanis]|nr:hypothetical protein K3495_g13959 [Podosphaera aphanis]